MIVSFPFLSPFQMYLFNDILFPAKVMDYDIGNFFRDFFFREKVNPFQKNGIKEKITSLLQIILIIAILSFISSFVQISLFELYSGLIFTLIIVNCPLFFILFWRKEEKKTHLIILINSFIIIVFVLQSLSVLIDPVSFQQYHSIKLSTIFPPLSYPLMTFHEEVIVIPPPPSLDIYYYSTYKIGIIIPLFFQFPVDDSLLLNYDMIVNQESVLQYQFFIFLLFFIVNFISTLGSFKMYTELEKKAEINKILDITFHTSVLLVNILSTVYILAVFVAYSIYRFDINNSMEPPYSFLLVLIIIIVIGLVLRFNKYPFRQESFQRLTKELLGIGVVGLILLLIPVIINTVSPLPDSSLNLPQFFSMIIVEIIIILMTLLTLNKNITPNQLEKVDEVGLQVMN